MGEKISLESISGMLNILRQTENVPFDSTYQRNDKFNICYFNLFESFHLL